MSSIGDISPFIQDENNRSFQPKPFHFLDLNVDE